MPEFTTGPCGDLTCSQCYTQPPSEIPTLTRQEWDTVSRLRLGEDVPAESTVDTTERVRCSYAERNCLRRDNNGTVPVYDENGRRQVETCNDCGETFCTVHRHTSQRRPENYCEGAGAYHARCRLASECSDCGHRFCEEDGHEPGSVSCESWSDQDALAEEDEDSYSTGPGHYRGPFREAELLFEGDTPVPGLAEGKRYLSLELEAEVGPGGSGSFTLPEKFGITSDGSLRNGVEVTLPPSRMDAFEDNVRTAVNALVRGGYRATERCGMHTHIDLRDKVNDNKFLSHLFATFYAVEDILFAMQNPRRVQNQYCTPLRNGWRFYDAYGKEAANFDFVYYKQPKTLASKMRLAEQKRYKGGPRYNAFNFHSVWYRGTLEVRLHEGLLDTERALLWAELLQYIVARVESGITYPTLRKLVDMDVSPRKLELFGRVFRLPDALLNHVQQRIMQNNSGMISFRHPNRVSLGVPKKGRAIEVVPRRKFKATHRRCRWCGSVIPMDRRCSYCRREPLFTRDAWGMADEPVMSFGMSQDDYGRRVRQVMTEAEYNNLIGGQQEFAAVTDPDSADY